MDKPWYKRNIDETLYFTVFQYVNLMQNPQLLISTVFGNQNRKDVVLKGMRSLILMLLYRLQ
ncbi:hypothetical protein I4U23_015673 [Adineta vaga]|nr:hypothetical protein I4U23_015673 [Adineta vaga]